MNTTIKLNTKLIGTLSVVTYMPAAEIVSLTSINRATWYRIVQNPEIITIQQLIAVANGLQIPVRRLFSTDKIDVIGKREDYIMEPYIPCRYDADALKDIIASRSDVSWKKAANTIGINRDSLRKSLLAKTRLPVVRLLDVCETFDIDPFTILIDPNPETTQTPNKPNKRDAANDIEQLRQQIAQLSSDIADLTKKYDDLRLFYEDMSHHLGCDIHHVNQNTISLVAESPKTKYNKKK